MHYNIVSGVATTTNERDITPPDQQTGWRQGSVSDLRHRRPTAGTEEFLQLYLNDIKARRLTAHAGLMWPVSERRRPRDELFPGELGRRPPSSKPRRRRRLVPRGLCENDLWMVVVCRTGAVLAVIAMCITTHLLNGGHWFA